MIARLAERGPLLRYSIRSTTLTVEMLRGNKIQGIKMWREAFRIVDDVFLPKHCRIKYEAVKQIVFKNVEINYEAVGSCDLS